MKPQNVRSPQWKPSERKSERYGSVCVCMGGVTTLCCGSRDRRAAGQRWQVEPMFYSALSECVMPAQPGHLKIKVAISPRVNHFCPLPMVPPHIFHSSFFSSPNVFLSLLGSEPRLIHSAVSTGLTHLMFTLTRLVFHYG